MKKYIAISAIALILMQGCDKKEESPKEDIMGTVSCTYNGTSWDAIAGGFGFDARKDTFFSIEFFNAHNYVRSETMVFYNLRKGTEKQSIFKRSPIDTVLGGIYLTSDLEDDVSCDSYEIVESDSLNNWIQITEEKTIMVKSGVHLVLLL